MNSQTSIVAYMRPNKRPASSDTEDMPDEKKLCEDSTTVGDKPAQEEGKMGVEKDNAGGSTSKNGTSIEFDKMLDKLTGHLTKITSDMEERISAQIATSIQAAIAKEIATAIETVREEFTAEMEALKERVQTVEDRPAQKVTYAAATANSMDNVVFMSGIAVTDHENIVNKAKSVIKDGCKVKDAKVTSAERKKGYNGRPGVVMVTLENKDQVDSILKGCRNLKDSNTHKRVYIERHMDKDMRAMRANARTLLKACGKDKEYGYKGAFLVKKEQQR